MSLRVKGSVENVQAWKRRVYFEYENNQYVVNLFHDVDTGFELLWLEKDGKPISQEPSWVKEYEKTLRNKSFMLHLDELSSRD